MHRFLEGNENQGVIVFNCTGSPLDDLAAYAEGYHQAGKALIEKMASKIGYSDFEGYPILFLYRHALELYLKAITFKAADFLKLIKADGIDQEKISLSHKLTTYFPAIKAVLDATGQLWDSELTGLESLDDFRNLIRELDDVTLVSDISRYPMAKTGRVSIDRNFVINIISFGKNMAGLLEYLDSMESWLDYKFDDFAAQKYHINSVLRELGISNDS